MKKKRTAFLAAAMLCIFTFSPVASIDAKSPNPEYTAPVAPGGPGGGGSGGTGNCSGPCTTHP